MSATAQPSDDTLPTDEEPTTEEKAERLKNYLAEEAKDSDIYVKSKFIADDVGMSAREIGQLMARLKENASTIEIEKWSYTSATTWRVTSA